MVTKPRQVRVDDDLWEAFGSAADSIGSDRAKLLTAFMRRFVAVMDPAAIARSADTDPRPAVPTSAP